ncbi:MAG: hypothetical protein AAF708_17970 [Deinococcota bacterium]
MTCQNAKVLAKHSKFRYIAACTCCEGVVHISWDVATFHLHQADFFDLRGAVAKLIPPATGQAQTLWIGTTGIALNPTDYRILCELVNSAFQHLPLTTPTQHEARALN